MFRGKPVIAVMPLYDDEKESYWMLPGYMKVLEQQGAIPLMPSLTDDAGELDYFLETCDGFLLTGGHDVSPAVYGETASPACGLASPLRDNMEAYILKHAIEMDKAVFGICRGVQFMNAALGGSLYQDLPTEHPSGIEHHMTPPYDRCAHTVRILPGTPLYDILQKEECPVNSYHHQAIRELAGGLRAAAVSPDGLTEAAYMPGKNFIAGVQWHPELSYQNNEDSRALILAFIEAAKRRQKR